MPSGRPSYLLLLCGAIALAAIAALLPVGGTPAPAAASAEPAVSRTAFPAWAHGGAATRALRPSQPSSPGLAQTVPPSPSWSSAGIALLAVAGVLFAAASALLTATIAQSPLYLPARSSPPTPPPRMA